VSKQNERALIYAVCALTAQVEQLSRLLNSQAAKPFGVTDMEGIIAGADWWYDRAVNTPAPDEAEGPR
jgi:hypothetical protein